jgi:hypothetical protein
MFMWPFCIGLDERRRRTCEENSTAKPTKMEVAKVKPRASMEPSLYSSSTTQNSFREAVVVKLDGCDIGLKLKKVILDVRLVEKRVYSK